MPTFNPSAPLNQGSLGWWLAHPDYFAGTTWPDLTGNGHDGSFVNLSASDWQSDSPTGGFGSLDCPVSDDGVVIPDAADLDGMATMSHFMRVRFDAYETTAGLANEWNMLLDKNTAGVRPFSYQSASEGASQYWAIVSTGANRVNLVVTNDLTPFVGQWIDLLVTFDGSTASVFLNGSLADSQALSGTVAANAADIGLGGRPPFSDLGLNANISLAEWRLWDRVVSGYRAEARAGYPTTLRAGNSRRHNLFRP